MVCKWGLLPAFALAAVGILAGGCSVSIDPSKLPTVSKPMQSGGPKTKRTVRRVARTEQPVRERLVWQKTKVVRRAQPKPRRRVRPKVVRTKKVQKTVRSRRIDSIIVGKNDTLRAIAKDYGVTVYSLMHHNKLTDTNIVPGQRLKIR